MCFVQVVNRQNNLRFTTCIKNVNQQRIMDLSHISLAVAQVLIFPKMQVEKNTSEAAVYGKSNATLEKL